MPGQHTTRPSLLARVSGDTDPHAWREFCDRYGDLIRSFALRRGLQGAYADDVLQDVLVALTKSMPGFQYDPAKGKFRSYLKTMVVRSVFRRTFQKRADIPLEVVESAAPTTPTRSRR